jgi:hypothetical protein
MPTLFNPEYAEDSDRAHLKAREDIYPLIFDTNQLKFKDTSFYKDKSMRKYDCEKAVDRIVSVECNLLLPMKFTIQERFRNPVTKTGFEAYKKRDITVTEFNHETNEPAELFKFECDYFLYGYFNKRTSVFGEAILINIPSMKKAIANGSLKFSRGMNDKNQSFIGIHFDELFRINLVEWHIKNY